jgi:hypothetical protein
MRIALFALLGATLLAGTPAITVAQRPIDGDLRDRVRDVILDRDNSQRSRDRDGRWDWERDDDRRRSRGDDRGRWGRNDDWKVYEREQRDFDKRTRRWSRRQWDAFRDCERDLWRRSRWDRNDSRREGLYERRRIRNYCESRVSRW